MASHQLTPAAAHKYGTSFSAPRVTNKLAVILDELQQLGMNKVSAPLLKAFLVNSVSYRGDLNALMKQATARTTTRCYRQPQTMTTRGETDTVCNGRSN